MKYRQGSRRLACWIYSATSSEGQYSDLNSVERERLRNIIRAYRGDSALLELNDEELNKALQFVTTENGALVPTFCGILMIGKEEAVKKCMSTAEVSI